MRAKLCIEIDKNTKNMVLWSMSLNNVRAKNDGRNTNKKISILEEEFHILKEVTDNPDRLKHQICFRMHYLSPF